MVDKIKDKEVVFLAWQESNFVCSNPCENIPFWRLILNRRRRLTKVERNRWWLLEGLLNVSILLKPFVGVRGDVEVEKKGRKKVKTLGKGEQDESISNDS
jgi:hypothetical protein